MYVLGDRKLTPWAQSLGLTKGMVSRINEGHIPRPGVLSLIGRVEGVSLNWLMDGYGPPFHLTLVFEPAEAWNAAMAFVEDEAWAAYLLESKSDRALLLALPTSIEIDDTRVEYLAVEILTAGPAMDWYRIAAHARGGAEQVVVSDRTMQRIRRGEVGRYALLGADGHGGIIQDCRDKGQVRPLEEGAEGLDPAIECAEESPVYGQDPADDLAAAYRRLAEQDPAAARRELLHLLEQSMAELERGDDTEHE